jgi:NADPH:quinone reductase-like Zn-dependent oxidoreductase
MAFPLVPGAEIAGELLQVGAAVSKCRVGDRVMCTVPCGGATGEVVVPDSELVPVPVSMSFEQAAAVPVGFMTAYALLC